MAHDLNYLTVQDLMWVNLQVTGRSQNWDFAQLEEAVFLQYGYGGSQDLVAQAARFMTRFAGMHPFESGNEACAFIGTLGFLGINGRDLFLEDSDGLAFYLDLTADSSHAREKLEVKLTEHDLHTHHGTPEVRAILGSLIESYAGTVRALVEQGVAAPLR